MKMPEWMRRFADICTEGHLALLAARTSTRVHTVDSRLPCPECGLPIRLALTRDLGRCIYCRRVFTGAELMELGRRGSHAR